MKKVFIAMVVFFAMNIASISQAYENLGTVTRICLNPNDSYEPDRSACIQMSPALSTTWACMYTTDNLYWERFSMLKLAYNESKTCKILWDSVDPTNGFAIITIIECE